MRVETIVRRLSADKLRVYALYKQATEGPCSAPKPRLMDGLTKHAKWSAWKDLGDLAPEDAKAAYVRLVDHLDGGAEDAAEDAAEGADEGADDGGFGGPVFSRPERMPSPSGNGPPRARRRHARRRRRIRVRSVHRSRRGGSTRISRNSVRRVQTRRRVRRSRAAAGSNPNAATTKAARRCIGRRTAATRVSSPRS